MKRGATRQEVILTTQELISRNGIRAVRVDEIAQVMGISKRTLYEMFNDKTELMTACLKDMCRRRQQRIASCRRRKSRNSLQRAFRLVYEYIDSLFTVESSFLKELKHKEVFAEYFAEQRKFWCDQLSEQLESCRKESYLLPEIDVAALADQIIDSMLELRLKPASPEELRFFCRTLLRGAATQHSIEQIDGK